MNILMIILKMDCYESGWPFLYDFIKILETLFKKPLQIINHFINILHSNLAARFNA